MNFVSIRMITADIQRLVTFYEKISGVAAHWYSEDFAEIATPSCTLAIASERTMQLFAAGSARPADNHSLILEFLVADVDAEYRQLSATIGKAVQEPTTMPWGNRSLLFRDPDGNLVNFFTPVSNAAIEKFARRQHIQRP